MYFYLLQVNIRIVYNLTLVQQCSIKVEVNIIILFEINIYKHCRLLQYVLIFNIILITLDYFYTKFPKAIRLEPNNRHYHFKTLLKSTLFWTFALTHSASLRALTLIFQYLGQFSGLARAYTNNGPNVI